MDTPKRVYGYIRISDKDQEDGTSPEEQKDAIERHAQKKNLTIIGWHQETRSASKHGRPEFTKMLSKLRRGQADGVIIHKVDRSARNGRDFSALMELHEQKGIYVGFAHNDVDITTRSGRLMVEIEAVLAADFSRNLSEEVKKGLYGRLKQGIYPFTAPVGYLDKGKGQPKAIDPVKAPLVKKLFELYATGDYTLETLLAYANTYGLTNIKNKPLCINSISLILHNPFYTGIIKIKKNQRTYLGKQTPIISTDIFELVQKRFRQHKQPQIKKHSSTLKGLVRCHECDYGMPAEKQRGHYYHRCHQKGCPTKTLREDIILDAISEKFDHFYMSEAIRASVRERIQSLSTHSARQRKQKQQAAKLAENKLASQSKRLTDLVINGTLDEETYLERKEELNIKRQKAAEQAAQYDQNLASKIQRVDEILELCFSARIRGFPEITPQMRETIKLITSNISVSVRNPVIELKKPFDRLANGKPILRCAQRRDCLRTEKAKSLLVKDHISCPKCRRLDEVAKIINDYASGYDR